MDRSANVTSIDAIRALRTALVGYEGRARDALTALVLEVRRAVDWLENDRRRYWREQAKRASEQLAQARNDLERCQLKYGSEEAPSCYEQKKAFERAKRRLRLCEEKVRVVQRWIRVVRQELNEFDGQIARMNNGLDTDLPRAITALDRMVRVLEKYVSSSLPQDSRSVPRTQDKGESPQSDGTSAEQKP